MTLGVRVRVAELPRCGRHDTEEEVRCAWAAPRGRSPVFTAQEEQLLRRLVDVLRHISTNRRAIVMSEALQRTNAEDGTPTLPARDAETIQVSRRISPNAVPDPDDRKR